MSALTAAEHPHVRAVDGGYEITYRGKRYDVYETADNGWAIQCELSAVTGYPTAEEAVAVFSWEQG